MEREKNMLDHLAVIVRWRKLILFSFLAVTLVTAGISLMMPVEYRAQAEVYPPKENQGSLGLSSLLNNLPMGILGGLGQTSVSATEFVPVLQSQHVADAVIRRFNLAERYHARNREQLLGMVASRLDVQLTREQFLTVSYEARTPQRAADITNAFVEELDRALQQRRKEQAVALRDYLETRLTDAEKKMHGAERAYNRFQQAHMAVDLDTQAKAEVESANTLISDLGQLIIQRAMAARVMEPGHPQLKQLDLKIQGAREALDRMLMGQTDSSRSRVNDSLPSIFIPFKKMPDLGLQAVELKRNIEISNAVYQLLFQEYEKARFEAEKETPMVTVLDRAVPPDTRSRPRRTLMVLSAGGLSLALSTLLAFIFEAVRGMEGENRDKLNAIAKELRRK